MVADVVGVPGLMDTPESIELTLDPGIRAFVLIPIFLVVFLRSILQQNLSQLMKNKPKENKLEKIKHSQNIMRSSRTRGNLNNIPLSSYKRRHRYLNEVSLKAVEVKKKEPGEQDIEGMTQMMSMMKGNTVSYISNIGFMMWVNSFFAGFLLIRLPFNVSETFRPLVQRDVMLQPFDCSYVSSLSWYFISFFGLSGLTKFLLNTTQNQDMKMMEQQMSMPMMPGMGMPGAGAQPPSPFGGGGYDPNPMLKTERNELKVTKHDWAQKDIEKKLLKKWDQSL
mmetsp:Transcript_72771/g.89257  ORF Transcript_72771/g.89257 Transcript_72771/m.89257 type:complete len:280 (-) Transcript_72771:41-880(-)